MKTNISTNNFSITVPNKYNVWAYIALRCVSKDENGNEKTTYHRIGTSGIAFNQKDKLWAPAIVKNNNKPTTPEEEYQVLAYSLSKELLDTMASLKEGEETFLALNSAGNLGFWIRYNTEKEAVAVEEDVLTFVRNKIQL